MRKDMHKVVIERPRWNPGPPKFGRAANLPDDLQPKYQGMRQPYKCRKAFTDLLGPLRRWLQSQVGRPWNDVYSDACEVIKADSIIRLHVKTHLLEFVERNTFMHEGKVCYLDTCYGGGIRRIGDNRFGWGRFYLHPETGLLEKARPLSRREWNEARRETKVETFRWLNDQFALKRINGVWFVCHFRPMLETGRFKIYDHALCQRVPLRGLIECGGQRMHCFFKRQLSRRELRRFQLQNVAMLDGSPVFWAHCASKTELRCVVTKNFAFWHASRRVIRQSAFHRRKPKQKGKT